MIRQSVTTHPTGEEPGPGRGGGGGASRSADSATTGVSGWHRNGGRRGVVGFTTIAQSVFSAIVGSIALYVDSVVSDLSAQVVAIRPVAAVPGSLRRMASRRGSASTTELRIGGQASDAVGNTPLVALDRLGEDLAAEVVAKLEYFNPAGSVKDRIGVAMIDAAEADGLIERGRSRDRRADQRQHRDRAGDGLRGARLPLILTLPEGMSRERSALLRTYGAEVHETPSLGGMNEAVDLARQIVDATDDGFMPQQFNNPANPEIHRRTTAEEIWRDLDGEVDAFVAGSAPGGTITGVGQVLKERRPGVHVFAVEPAGSPVLSGGPPGPAQDPGDRRRLRPRGARPLGDRRGHRRGRATRSRSGPRGRGDARGPAGRDLGRGGDPRRARSRPRREMAASGSW